MVGKTNSVLPEIIDFIKSIPTKEYQALEYLESDGLSYIDTKLRSHSNMTAELKFEFTTVPKDGCLVGCRHTSQQQGEGKSRLYFYHYYQGHKLGYGMYLGKGTAEKGKIYHVKTRLDQGHQYMYLDGSLAFEGFDDYYIDNIETFYIFALNDGNIPATTDEASLTRETTFYTQARLYFLKIWDEEKLVRNYIPVRRIEDNTLGLYDMLNRVFYTNSGTGNFIGGPDVNNIVISNNNKV